MTDAKRYLLYARKSTDVEDKQVRSIDAQITELRDLALRSALTVVDTIIEKESAKTPGRRREFNMMLKRIEEGEADGILTWHPDRLARNMTDGGRIIDLIDTGKITSLRFPTFWFDTTPQGKFMLSMAFSQSKYYIDSMAENTRRGHREKVRRGEYPGTAPIGYLNDRHIKQIIVDSERAPLVRQAYERYSTGTETLDTIRQFLAANGLGSRAAGSNKPLSRITVAKLLTNPIYFGQFKYAGEIHDGIHTPIISKNLYDKVQYVMKDRRKWTASTRRAQSSKAFLGLLKCAECGGSITAEVQKGHTYYRCTKKGKMHQWCQQPYIREEALDAEICRLLSLYVMPDGWADIMLANIAAEEKEKSASSYEVLARYRMEIDTIKQKIDRLLEMRLGGEIDANKHTLKKEELMSRRKTLEENIAELTKGNQPWLEPLENWILTAKNLRQVIQFGTLFEKRYAAEKVFGSNLFLDLKKARGEAVKPWNPTGKNPMGSQLVHLFAAARTYFQGEHPQ